MGTGARLGDVDYMHPISARVSLGDKATCENGGCSSGVPVGGDLFADNLCGADGSCSHCNEPICFYCVFFSFGVIMP